MNSYYILELAGEGSFGRVYKGKNKQTGQVVALKFMPKLGRSDKELQSLKREIDIMRRLQHPNIVQMFDSFDTEAEVVVVTEYAEAQLFEILMDKGNLPENQVREIACQLVSALYYLHSHRILHRDMKPQNILLGKSGVVKLCDFGFARAMSVSTFVLTSIKGTPLYMSPELVEEKPYDHTSDLWSLGCILYELHTGAPPFYTNSIFHLVQLIVRDAVKWPDTMSDVCMSFLKGLLTKDPQKRLAWPDLLHHPFVADGVTVLPNTSVSSPLTAQPSPDILALKVQQAAEKTVPTSGESRLLRKVREQSAGGNRGRPVQKKEDGVGSERAKSAPAPTSQRTSPPSSGPSVVSLDPKKKASRSTKHRGQISRDYEQEFPSVEVGPQLVRGCSKERPTTPHRQDVDSEIYWEKLVRASDPNRQQKEPLNQSVVTPQIKSKIQEFEAQLTGGVVEETCHIHLPLKVLRNMLLTSDLEQSFHIGQELGLPHVLFDLIHDTVEISSCLQPGTVQALGEMMVVLIIYWEKHWDCVEEEQSLDKFTETFVTILSQPNLSTSAPLAASVLSLFTQHDVNVQVDVDNLFSLLKNLPMDSNEAQVSLPSGWGLGDGLLSLLLYAFSEHENSSGSSLDPIMFVDLWKVIGISPEKTKPDTDFCSANGLCSLLSATLFVFTKDPYLCILVFTESESKCVFTLNQLLTTERAELFAEGDSVRSEVTLTLESLFVLSCHLLCFSFALDLPPHTLASVCQLYDSCGIVESLVQVIQTLPAPQLELPLSLLSRLLLCDPERSISRLTQAAASFFESPETNHRSASNHGGLRVRVASSLLADLLQLDELWDSAVELLTLLSQVARCSPRPALLQLHLEASVLHQALSHSHEQIRAATCRLLGNLDPLWPPTVHFMQPDIFQRMIDCLHDSCRPVRRTACRAVGNWLGYIAAGAGFKVSNGKGSDTTGWGKGKKQHKHKGSERETVGHLSAVLEHEVDEAEQLRWMEEARRSAAVLASLIFDPDALVRRHCCAALGNLLHVDGAVAWLMKEDVSRSLLKAACTDSHNAVRRAAVTTLCLYSKEDTLRQALMSLDARNKLLHAGVGAAAQCEYEQLIAAVSPDP